MRHATLKIALLVGALACATMCRGAEPEPKHILVRNNVGYYLVTVPANAPPSFKQIEITINLAGDGPTTPQPPAGNTTVEMAFNTAASIGNKQDAALLSAVYQKFADMLESGVLTPESMDTVWDRTWNTVKPGLKSDWSGARKSFDDAMRSATDRTQFCTDMGVGLSRYANTTATDILANDADVPEQINIDMILMIISAIIELLKGLGIIP